MWTEVCGRKFVDGSCGRKLWPGGGGGAEYKKVGVLARLVSLRGQFQNSRRASLPFLAPFSVEIDLMELKMTSKYVKEYSDPKKMDITDLKGTKRAFECTTLRFSRAMRITARK